MVLLGRARRVTRAAGVALLTLVLPSWLSAAIPGQNGRIAFQSTEGGPSHLAVVNSDGAGVRPLPFAPAQAAEPSWSPDGTQIAFAAGHASALHLWIMDFFTGDATPLTQDITVSDNDPAWSPDGTKIAFTRCGGSPLQCDVWVVNADGTSPLNLTQTTDSDDRQPAWSPDGTKIAFSTNRDGSLNIYTMGSDGSGPLKLTDTPDQDLSPDWSPDGTLIAFARFDASQVSTIWTMNATDGTNPLSKAPGEQPVYSPDGTLIAFVLTTAANSDLWTMNADGTGGLALVATPDQEVAPSWQPINAGTNVPPTAEAGDDATFTCESEETAAVLDGSASTDPDSTAGTNDDIALYEWWVDFGTPTEEFLGTGAVIDQLGLASGTYNVTLQVTDSAAQSDTDEVAITIDDQTPPQITASVSPSLLWPPNHRMVNVRSTVDAFDFCGPITTPALTSVTSNEPENGLGDGNTAPDIMGTNLGTEDFMFKVRAERSGTGTGRIYTVIYSATDPSGNVGEGSAEIKVPHDRGKGKGNGNGGQGSAGGQGKDKNKGKGKGNGNGNGNGNGHGHGKP
jgi:dipeptidyl aminopeptidase/acylaminoacyl peptidase